MNLFFALFLFARILLVPEECLTIQSAVILARGGDTISVSFGRGNGKRAIVTTSQIFGKEITFELRGEGKENLLKILERIGNLPGIDNQNRRSPGWTEQRVVNMLDATSDQQPHIAIDASHRPWVVWWDGADPYDLSYSRWNGSNWVGDSGLIPYDPRTRETRLRVRISFDGENRPWVIYHKSYPDNRGDIFFTRRMGAEWEEERRINLYDSTELDFAPRIDCNGGEMWCCWYGGRTDTSQYHIYVSKWNDTFWEPETDISFPIGQNEYGLHWFCDIAVDRYGHPHVVWGETWFTGRIYYRTHNGEEWLPPVIINNPDSIRCAGWPAPAITFDEEDNIHVVWIGFRPDGVPGKRQEVYYSKFDREGNRWLTPVQINRSDDYNDWYPDIALSNSRDIWVVWNKGFPNGCITLASHFDGNGWSEEEQIDDWGISYHNVCPEMAWDGRDFWVVWDGFTTRIDHTDIYYTRYLTLSIKEKPDPKKIFHQFSFSPNPFADYISLFLKRDGQEPITIYDINGRLIKRLTERREERNYSRIDWDGKDINDKEIPDGIYFVFLKVEGKGVVEKIIKRRRR
ncbi:MAG: T9SS type A sorting domain-containing protein [candidate division WOR-3 bacterium]